MADFAFHEMFPLGEDTTPYRRLTSDFVSTAPFEGQTILKVDRRAIAQLSREAFHDIAHFLRPSHLQQLRGVMDDPESSQNDRFVAYELMKNANIAAGGVLPMCQDTGTAIVLGKKGDRVWTYADNRGPAHDEAALSEGVFRAYTENNLRYSQMSALTMYDEVNTGNNLPAQVDLFAVPGDAYKFLFVAKGGGSANKAFLFQETKALLNPKSLLAFIEAKLTSLGTAACPPYHLAVVIGGTSAELTMKTVKLASCRYLDGLPTSGGTFGQAFRDVALEGDILKLAQKTGIGAQFGGKYFCYDVRVIRLPRHGASCPVGIGVSCAADRQAMAKITASGVYLEQLETNPAQYMPDVNWAKLSGDAIKIDLNRPMSEIRAALSKLPVKTRVMLTGPLIVARDIAHAKLKERVDRGEGLPQYFKDHPVYYAGPAKTPQGMVSGSFGPTTAGRMDSYVDEFQALGGSMVMLAKGNRSPAVRNACKAHGGFYLGSTGGPAARIAQECIRKVDVLEYPELGMEAIWKIEVEDFPAFVVVDDKGNDFFASVGAKD
jgi:fumarate hydratase, class I